jgi:hypothetical protein
MPGAAQEFIERLVGGFFVTRERDVTLTTTAAEILRNDPERVGWLIIVTGATQAQLAFNINIATATAILVPGIGGSFSANVREDFTLTTVSVYGNVAAGTTTLHIIEIIRVSA